MRFIFNASKDELEKLEYIKKHIPKMNTKEIFEHSIEFLWQLYYLMDNGYEICMIDPDGNKKYLKIKDKE